VRARWGVIVALAVAGLPMGASCGGSVDLGGSVCHPCATDTECGAGATCARFGGSSYCASLCPMGNECADTTTCATLSSVSIDEVTACIPQSGSCGAASDAGQDGQIACAALAAPSVTAACDACNRQSKNCQPNGCYNGWYCLVATHDCQSPPTGCDAGSPDAGKPD